jgi:DinB family protein
MTPAERERVATYLSETRENLLRTTRGLSPTQLQYKPAPDRWSVAECVEHIIVVEDVILSNIHKALQREPESTKPAMSDDEMLRTVTDRTNRIKGPDRLMPSGRWAHDQLLSEFETARKRTADFVAATSAPLRQYGYPHPIFGQFDCYQWALCIAAHGERHRVQAEEVMSDSGFPRAAAAR